MSGVVKSRLEADVGITLRLGPTPTLAAIIKERYSDFHVNEIRPDGTIVRLTTTSPPVEDVATDCAADNSEILVLVPTADREAVAQFQARLVASKDKKEVSNGPLGKETVQIKVTDLDKESRTKIHRWISTFDKLSSETVDKDGDKYIKIIPMTGNNRLHRRPASRARYTHCTLYKEGVETSEAIGLLSSKLNMKPGHFSYAGIKDKRAKTAQRLSISNVDAGRLAGLTKYFRNGVKLGNFSYSSSPIALGELAGNHFKLLLKDLKIVNGGSTPPGFEPDLESVVSLGVNSLAIRGFINYYGLQRFGSYAVSTYEVGREILRQNWIQAFDLLLSPKPQDSPAMISAKKVWLNKRDPGEAVKILNSRYRSIETSLLHGLGRYYAKNDFVGVFTSLPRHSRLLYVHAYQSLLWNLGASARIAEYGDKKAVVGDLVFVGGGGGDEEIVELDDCVDKEDVGISSAIRKKQQVRPLTQEDLDSEQYSIYDVVLPLFGTEVTYPENRMKAILLQLLKDEGIDPDSFTNFRPISDKPTGGYRKLIVRPKNVSHRLRTYSKNDCLDKFIPSDWDILQKREALGEEANQFKIHLLQIPDKNKEQAKKQSCSNETEEEKESKKTCVILEFSLPSSSYATMALRELLVEDVGAGRSGSDNNSRTESKNKPSEEKGGDDESSEPEPKMAKME